MQIKPFLSDQIYIHLEPDGTSSAVPGGKEFWSLPKKEIERYGRGWLISEYEFSTDWPTWEMHPRADEYVYLLSGELEMHMDEPDGIRVIVLQDRGAIVIPRGIWHTAKVKKVSRMLHVTMGAGTEIRPV
jgi:mannose-6-phosphate isomerase-like protein (cupin superfamily)